MNLNQKQIVEFIKSAINGEKTNVNIDEQIDWESIINLSREHKNRRAHLFRNFK